MDEAGRHAYSTYRLAMSEQGVEIDPWSDLDHEDQVAWAAVEENFREIPPA